MKKTYKKNAAKKIKKSDSKGRKSLKNLAVKGLI
jgi:hypothetical protein